MPITVDAHAIVANYLLSPSAAGNCVFRVLYGVPGVAYKIICGKLRRETATGEESALITLQIPGTVPLPPTAFPGRQVVYQVQGGTSGYRLTVTISATDGGAANEVWHQECTITNGATDQTTFTASANSASTVLTDVDHS